jgi:cell division protein FtsL
LRWVILGAIAVVLLVTLVPTARSLARQRAEIDALATQVAQQQSQVASLQAEQERWTDPAYVEQQARDRLKFVKVGDRSYTVIDPLEAARPPVSGASVAAPQANGDAPWYGQIWQSVQLADRPTAGMLPVTAPPTAP